MPMEPPDIGRYRQRLSYQVKSEALDSVNQPSNAWTTLGTFWAAVEPLTGMELMNARQLKATTGHKVWLRNVNSAMASAIAPSGRFLFESTGRVFGIDQVFRFEEQNAFLFLHCTELISPQ